MTRARPPDRWSWVRRFYTNLKDQNEDFSCFSIVGYRDLLCG